jgi:hypothetical protein
MGERDKRGIGVSGTLMLLHKQWSSRDRTTVQATETCSAEFMGS